MDIFQEFFEKTKSLTNISGTALANTLFIVINTRVKRLLRTSRSKQVQWKNGNVVWSVH